MTVKRIFEGAENKPYTGRPITCWHCNHKLASVQMYIHYTPAPTNDWSVLLCDDCSFKLHAIAVSSPGVEVDVRIIDNLLEEETVDSTVLEERTVDGSASSDRPGDSPTMGDSVR